MRPKIISEKEAARIVALQGLEWWTREEAAAVVRITPRQFDGFAKRTGCPFKVTPQGPMFKKEDVNAAMFTLLEWPKKPSTS